MTSFQIFTSRIVNVCFFCCAQAGCTIHTVLYSLYFGRHKNVNLTVSEMFTSLPLVKTEV